MNPFGLERFYTVNGSHFKWRKIIVNCFFSCRIPFSIGVCNLVSLLIKRDEQSQLICAFMKNFTAQMQPEKDAELQRLAVLEQIFAETFAQVTQRQHRPAVEVRFYAFAGVNHTIRLRNQKIYVRISDILSQAPRQVWQSLAHILVSKLLKKKIRSSAVKYYREYLQQEHLRRVIEEMRRQRGRKQITNAHGKYYDLVILFTKLNEEYFANQLVAPQLTWSRQRTRRVLGHHDAVHQTIVISRSLDQAHVPEFVINYVLYHEMLHIKHPPQLKNGKRQYHTAEFRAEEKRYAQYQLALQWLETVRWK